MLLSTKFTRPESFSLFLKTLCVAVPVYFLYKAFRWIKLDGKRRHAAKANGCLPPTKIKLKDPLFGLDVLWDTYQALQSHTVLDNLRDWYIKSGSNTVSLKMIQTFVSTTEPANLKCILATNFKDWELGEDRRKAMSWLLGDGIFTSDGAAWQHSRDMLRPNFVREQINDSELFEKHAGNLVSAIPRDGETMVDLQPLFYNASLDISSEFLFGRSTAVLDPIKRQGGGDREVEKFVDAFTYCLETMEMPKSRFGFLGLFLPDWSRKAKAKIVHNFVDNLIQQAITDRAAAKDAKSDRHSYVFLHELLDQTNDPVRIRSELLNILLAGRDTTASLLSNIWYEISRRPTMFTKLQQEVSTLDPGVPINFEKLKSLKYLQAIISESLRLYPVVPANARKAARDTILPVGGGPDGKSPIYMCKGQVAHWCLWAMHRRHDLYGADAEEFKPERWLDGKGEGEKGLRVGWEYLPFNGGPRICIGQQFALTETAWLTVRLLREFEGIESRDEEGVWREKLALTCIGMGGCKVVFTPRT